MADIADLLDRELRRGASEVEPENVELDLKKLSTEQISQLAELLSGVNVRSSTPYRSARRQLERWRKGGIKLTLRSQERLSLAHAQATQRIKDFRKHGAEMRVKVSWYGSRRPEWLPPGRWLHIRRPVMLTVIENWAHGTRRKLERAARTLWKEFLEQYEVPNPQDWLRDVEIIDLELEPGGTV